MHKLQICRVPQILKRSNFKYYTTVSTKNMIRGVSSLRTGPKGHMHRFGICSSVYIVYALDEIHNYMFLTRGIKGRRQHEQTQVAALEIVMIIFPQPCLLCPRRQNLKKVRDEIIFSCLRGQISDASN